MTQASLPQLREQAQTHRAAGRNAEAVTTYKQILAAAPDDLISRHNLAGALGDIGRHREAVEVLDAALKAGLDAPESWLVFARSLLGIRKLEEAQAAYRQVIARRPGNSEAHMELAQLIWMRTGDTKAALADLETAIAANPAATILRVMKAEILGQMGETKAQYALLADILEETRGDAEIARFAARAALTLEDFETALPLARRAAEARPGDVRAQICLIEALLAHGEHERAEAVVNTLLAREPLNQHFIALQATIWRLRGDDRYRDLYDYDAFVRPVQLTAPKGWDSLESYLRDLGEELDRAHRFTEHPFFQSARHGSQIASIEHGEGPAMRAYAEAARAPLREHLRELGSGPGPMRGRNEGGVRLLGAWSMKLGHKGFHVNHVHPAGWISSACHIRPPADDPDHPKAGWLKLGEPGCITLPALEPEHYVKPQAGVMVIFPSYMWHGTVRFHAGPPRVTIAADFGPDRI